MAHVGLYLGDSCPPNMAAYLDSLLFREDHQFDLVVSEACTLPDWLTTNPKLEIQRYSMDIADGWTLVAGAAATVGKYLNEHNPDEIRQITQPRWHALGVLLGARRVDIPICTRVSASMFTEYRNDPNKVRSFIANNILGYSVFLGDRVYTPKYGGVTVPWWSSANRTVEPRAVNKDRFTPEAEPNESLFDQDTRRVLTVGRISKQKGTDLVLDTAKKLEGWEFTLLGPVQDSSLAECADRLPNVNRHSPIDYTEMPHAYTAADMVLSASRVEWGGISRAMLEARATDRPVIALNKGDAGEVATQVVEEDPNSIVSVLKSVETRS